MELGWLVRTVHFTFRTSIAIWGASSGYSESSAGLVEGCWYCSPSIAAALHPTYGHAVPCEVCLKADLRLWPCASQNRPFNKRPSCGNDFGLTCRLLSVSLRRHAIICRLAKQKVRQVPRYRTCSQPSNAPVSRRSYTQSSKNLTM